MTRYIKRQGQSEETEQAPEPDIARMLELSDWELELNNVTNMNKFDRMQQHMGNISK